MTTQKEHYSNWYKKNKKVHYENVQKRRLKERTENKKRILAYFLMHPCVDCGITDPRVLTFDHVREKKRMDVSQMVASGYKWKAIQVEIDKCEVRCWNDHMRRTHERRILARSSVDRATDF